ncbi:hypothetical protein [Pedobacter zeae]|uniref:Uncharacterized protein n=2 Tax=Pedobacter zeae TaxID=1737356 RepID=A0A7W6KBE6_9SPHI|nr:hypothetical protein [Pedobacter zeae]MBB4107761.1 hypothetical protein [Pedobacter zeae]
MHTRTFTYIPTKVGSPMLVTIDQDDEVLNVTIGDTYLGSMVENEQSPYGWETTDPLLLEELPDLSMALKEEKAMENLPYALKDLFGESIAYWEWEDDQNLRVIAHPDLDLSEFANAIRDQINEIVLFDKTMVINLSQNDKTEEIYIN